MWSAVRSRVFDVAHPREVWLVTGAHGVNEFYSVALPPILPLLVSDFTISYGEAGALLTIFFVTYSIFQLPAGVLADRIGQRWLLAGGMVVLSGGLLLAAFAQRYETLLISQAFAGVGGSTYHPTGMSLISDLETSDTEGKAMGIHGLGGVIGTALAPALVGGLAAVFDWRLALGVGAGVGVVYAVVFLLLFAKPRATGESPARTDGGESPETARETPSGLRRRLARLVDAFPVPRKRWVGVLFLANLSIATQVGAVRTFTTSYLVDVADMSTLVANGVFFVMLVGAGASSLAGGTLADAVDRPTLGFVTMLVSMALLVVTGFVPPRPTVLFLWFFILGAVLWGAFPAMNALTSAYSERSFSGSLFGVMLTAASLGSAGGPLLFGVAAELYGLHGALVATAGVSLVGAVAFLLARQF